MRQARWDCVFQVLLKVQKASKKALAHLKDHLERSLRPIHATQKTNGPFWTRQKLKSFRLKIKIWWLGNYFPLKETHNSLSLWNCFVLRIRWLHRRPTGENNNALMDQVQQHKYNARWGQMTPRNSNAGQTTSRRRISSVEQISRVELCGSPDIRMSSKWRLQRVLSALRNKHGCRLHTLWIKLY